MTHTISLNGNDWLFKGYIGEDWLWRDAHKAETRDVRGWKPASVPGSVQHDLWKAGMIPDPYVEMNSLAIEWVSERTWLYKKRFSVDARLRGLRVALVFLGVDYTARFYLNGELLGASRGMYLPVSFEVGERLHYGEENLLTVVIDPAPFEQPQIGYTSKVYTQKARMGYWWDFCPRVINLGLWQECLLKVSGPARIEDIFIRPQLANDFHSARMDATVAIDRSTGESAPAEVTVAIHEPGSATVLIEDQAMLPAGQREAHFDLLLENPRLWWPNGAGEQALYEAEVTVRVGEESSDTRRIPFGVRKIEFVQNEGAAAGSLPYNLVVNGQKQYIKGWNWVPADVLYGTVQTGRYEHLLKLAYKANVNLLRVWGGGLIERETFYTMCDRLGILVWQEFIQSSSGIDNVPSEDPDFIRFLVENAEMAIRLRRNHPSLAVWCGGNELHYAQDRLCDERHPALAALRETVQRLDPGRHWVATSPAGGVFSYKAVEPGEDTARYQDVHGPWEYQGLRKQYTLYNRGQSLLHSEFGVEGITNLRTLNHTIAADHQWPIRLENPYWEHLGAWWVKAPIWEEAFGPLADVPTAQRATQFLQADGLRYALEADRRRAFHNGGTMPWQFNEPYPMAACTSAVDYFGEPKPVYYTVARAYRPLSVTARFDTLAWGGETEFAASAWCSNFDVDREGELIVRIIDQEGQTLHEERAHLTCPRNAAREGPSIRLPLDRITGDIFLLDLGFYDGPSGSPLATNRYLFSKRENLMPLLSVPPARISAEVVRMEDFCQIRLRNVSQQTALWLWIEAEKTDLRSPGRLYFADNYFCLLPGEERTIPAKWVNVPEEERVARISGWNVEVMLLK